MCVSVIVAYLHVLIWKIILYACRPGGAKRNQCVITYQILVADDHFYFCLFLCNFCTCGLIGPGEGAFPTFHFLFVIVVSFPFLPSLSFCVSRSVSALCETPVVLPPRLWAEFWLEEWSASLSCTSDQGMWQSSHSPPLLFHTVMCVLFVCEVTPNTVKSDC